MKVAFHCNQLSIRGTEVAMYDYAHYNEVLLGNESIVLAKHPDTYKLSHPRAIQKFQDRFPEKVFFYTNNSEIEGILDANNIDVFYAQKSGHNDGVLSTKRKTVIHAVFRDYQPHGNVYAFISEWLAKVYGNKNPFVPYMVDLPNHDADLREKLGIPKEAIVLGRHGGRETFDLPFVHKKVIELATKRKDVYFLFMNTEQFSSPIMHNIIYLDAIADLTVKTEFINTCDAMLHARLKGETFGLAVAEFSLRNKPVITYSKSLDMAHGDILGKDAFYYSNAIELDLIFANLDNYLRVNNQGRNWNKYAQFSPEKVMNKFKTVFLDANK